MELDRYITKSMPRNNMTYCTFTDDLLATDYAMSAGELVWEIYQNALNGKLNKEEVRQLYLKYKEYNLKSMFYHKKKDNKIETFQGMIDAGIVSVSDLRLFSDEFRSCDLTMFYDEWNKDKINQILNDEYVCVKQESGLPEFHDCDVYLGLCKCGESHDIYSWPEYYRFDVVLNTVLVHEAITKETYEYGECGEFDESCDEANG